MGMANFALATEIEFVAEIAQMPPDNSDNLDNSDNIDRPASVNKFTDRPSDAAPGQPTNLEQPAELETIEIKGPKGDRLQLANPSPFFTDAPPSRPRPRLIPLDVPESLNLPGKSFQLDANPTNQRSRPLLTAPPANQTYPIADPTLTRTSDPTFSGVANPTGRFRR